MPQHKHSEKPNHSTKPVLKLHSHSFKKQTTKQSPRYVNIYTSVGNDSRDIHST